MLIKSEARLIFVGYTQGENGSPIKNEIARVVKVDIASTFSDNFYFERGREMRSARNIVCNTYNTADIVEEGVTYQLKYVEMNGKRYTVENIMNYRHMLAKRLLDLKETL